MVRRHVGLVQPYVLRVEVSCFSSFHPKPILRRWLGGTTWAGMAAGTTPRTSEGAGPPSEGAGPVPEGSLRWL